MDAENCFCWVTQFLIAQGWELIDPRELAERICAELLGQGMEEKTLKEAVQQKIWPIYAAVLHDACWRPQDPRYERAWMELRTWLLRQARRGSYQPEIHEDLVQETVIELQQKLQTAPLRTPVAFLIFALRILQNKAIDLARREQTLFRGGEVTTLSLEEAEPAAESGYLVGEIPAAAAARETEHQALNQLAEEQLIAFFREHLPTELQQAVAWVSFVEGMEPKAIAARLGKRDHEIRLVKARVLDKLRNLPPAGQRQLLNILSGESEGEV